MANREMTSRSSRKTFQFAPRRKKIVKNDGEPIAEARNEKIADEVAERLNAEESIREEDRWSA